MHNRQGINLKGLWEAACDYHLWPVSSIPFGKNVLN
jgi:hypothetical protein